MPDQPTPEQFFSIHLKSLTDFADEFKTQIDSIQAPMDHLATMSDTPPQYGAFNEAWSLGAGEQAAIEEMYSLLGQVKQAIAFAGTVTGTVADGYRHADENISSALGGPAPTGSAPVGTGHYEHGGPGGHQWQVTSVGGAVSQILFPDPGSTAAADPGSLLTDPVGTLLGHPGGTDPSGGFVDSGPTDSAPGMNTVAAMVTPSHHDGGHLPVWTPPPAHTSGPDPSWTDYFQGTPNGGA